VAAHLVDAATDIYLWADHFDCESDGAFEAQDTLAEQLAGAIVPRLERLEIENAKRQPDEALDARVCTLRGIASLYRWTKEGIAEALGLFQRAIEINPEFAPAYGLAAYCYVQRQSYGWFTDRQREAADAVRLARGAVQLCEDDALTLSKAAHAITMLGGDVDSGAALIDQALLCNRHLPAAWYVSGWVQLHLGRPQSALEHLAHALRLGPSDPLNFKVYAAVAYAHFLEGRYDDGALCAARALSMRPRYQTALRAAAANHALAGRVRQAQKFMTSMLQHDPALRLSRLRDVLPLGRQQDFSKCANALQQAGLPD
jgi:tetratricopeptide (TPR) repeat protein